MRGRIEAKGCSAGSQRGSPPSWCSLLPPPPSLPLDLTDAAPAGAPQAAIAFDGAEGAQPAAGVSSAEPVTLGILSRPSLVETTLWLPPVKSPALRPAAHKPPLAHGGDLVLAGEPRSAFQRSAVGTARTPTGPPA